MLDELRVNYYVFIIAKGKLSRTDGPQLTIQFKLAILSIGIMWY